MKKGKFEKSRATTPKPAAPKAKPTKAAKAAKPPKEKKPVNKKVPVAIGSVCLLAVLGVFAYAMVLNGAETIRPDLKVAGVEVGGLTVAQATEKVNAELNGGVEIQDLVVTLPDHQVVFAGQELAISYDVEAAVEQVWQMGRGGGFFDALLWNLGFQDAQASVVTTDYMSYNESYVDEVLAKEGVDAQSELADSTYELTDDTLTISVGTNQRTLDTEALKTIVVESLYDNNYEEIQYSYTETLYNPVDLTKIYNDLCVNVEDAYYDTETKSIVPEVLGYGFDLEAANQKQAMADQGSQLVFKLEPMEPEVTQKSLEETMFTDVLGEYDSPHVWNTPRTTNLQLAAKAIDGTILNPGEEFSFNKIVGERTAAKGYQSAAVYVSGNTESQLGGGVCQVASTIYMATLLADLEVSERTEHMFSVTYVPMGMDATIYWGALDYKFVNSTDHPLRIDCVVENGYVYVDLMGQKDTDTTVDMSYTVLSVASWTDVTVEDEDLPADYKQVTVSPYTGYKVQTFKQYLDADGNPVGEPISVAYSNYSKRDQVTTIGKQEEKPEEGETGTEGEGETTTPETTTPGTTTPETTTPETTTPETTTPETTTPETTTPETTTPETSTPETTTPEPTTPETTTPSTGLDV